MSVFHYKPPSILGVPRFWERSIWTHQFGPQLSKLHSKDAFGTILRPTRVRGTRERRRNQYCSYLETDTGREPIVRNFISMALFFGDFGEMKPSNKCHVNAWFRRPWGTLTVITEMLSCSWYHLPLLCSIVHELSWTESKNRSTRKSATTSMSTIIYLKNKTSTTQTIPMQNTTFDGFYLTWWCIFLMFWSFLLVSNMFFLLECSTSRNPSETPRYVRCGLGKLWKSSTQKYVAGEGICDRSQDYQEGKSANLQVGLWVLR